MTTPPGGPDRRGIALALIAGLVVHLVMGLGLNFDEQAGDARFYVRMAENLAEHGVLSLETEPPHTPTIYRSPIYPTVMSVFAIAFGSVPPGAVYALQTVLTLLAGLAFAEAWGRIQPGSTRAIRVAVLASPVLAAFDFAILTEAMVTAGLLLAFSLPVLSSGPRLRFVLTGVALGASILTRDAVKGMPVLALIALTLPPVRRSLDIRGPRLAAPAWLLTGVLLVLLPWGARNYAVTGDWFLTTKGRVGVGLWLGTWETNDEWTKHGGIHDRIPPESVRGPEDLARVRAAFEADPAERDRIFFELAIDRIRDEPLAVVGRWFMRTPYTWIGSRISLFGTRGPLFERGAAGWYALKGGLWALNSVVAIFGLAGVLRLLWAPSGLAWMAVPFVYIAIAYFPLHSIERRYSHPAYPFLLAFAVTFGLHLIAKAKQRRATRR